MENKSTVKARKGSRARNVPWDEIRIAYVTREDRPGCHQLEGEFGLARSTVQKKAKKEGWKAQRDKHRGRVIEKAKQKIERKQSIDLAKSIQIPVAREEEQIQHRDTEGAEDHEETAKPLLDGLERVLARQRENLEAQVGRIWRRHAEPGERLREVERLRLRYGGAYEAALFRGLGGGDGALAPRARAELLVDVKKMAASRLAGLESEVKRGLIASAAGGTHGVGAGEEDAIRGLREVFERFRLSGCSVSRLSG